MRLNHYYVPTLVHIETTYACNSNCRFCYNPKRENFKADYARLDRIVESVAKSEIPHVYLIGGEPSLLPVERLNRYIERLSEKSSVTIVTNGVIRLDGISRKLACLGVPIHGNEATHEYFTRLKGGYKKAISSIKAYADAGFDVRCIPVLMSKNHDQMYEVIRTAAELGAESVFVDKFESGGLGSKEFEALRPSNEEFEVALTQMIAGQRDFGIKVGFGTAIPFCLDSRLVKEKMYADCGAGTTFAAIDPEGNLRICNQSRKIYGNVLERHIEEIWNDPKLDEFRNLEWVTEPCRSCALIQQCACGCKVDTNCKSEYCIDYAVRNNGKGQGFAGIPEIDRPVTTEYPSTYRRFRPNPYFKILSKHPEKYAVTRYQTVILDEAAVMISSRILDGVTTESTLIREFRKDFDEEAIRVLVSQLEQIKAIDITGDEK